MDRVNPRYIPRNHNVERALEDANVGDYAAFERLLHVLSSPYDERPDAEDYASPAPDDFGPYTTYYGT
ncbi:MAG: hypothetical protein KDB80_10225 [Planctomycetes bacterium]|nr:hypothetical protein [Planctomycetota bacterium]